MRVTAVVPSWNDARMLRRCLAALATQTRPADEVIVVDNASTDDTADLARTAGARVVTEPVRGIARATASGFDAALGMPASSSPAAPSPNPPHDHVLLRLDADSLPPADWIERIVRAFEHDPALDAMTGPAEFTEGGAVRRWIGRRVYIAGYFWSMRRVLGHWPVFGSNCALRATLWNDIRLRTHRTVRRMHDDLDISFAFAPGTRVTFDPGLIVGVSPRPFDSVGQLGRRLWWAALTIGLNWAEESWWHRRRRWRRAASDRSTADAAPSRTANDPTRTPRNRRRSHGRTADGARRATGRNPPPPRA